MKKILVAVLAIVFVWGSFGLVAQANTPGTGDITVFVNPGNAVNGATVSFTVNGQIRTAQSNYMGMAKFTNVPVGTYTFKASKSGYTDVSASFKIAEGTSNVGSLFLGDQVGNATITVLDNNTHRPVRGVQVSVSANSSQQYQNTDANGVATLTNIHSGTYTFKTLVSGYKDNSASVTVTPNSTASATIMIEPLTVVHGQTGDITVFVNPGDAVNGATVSFTVNGQMRTAQSDSKGMAKFTGIPSGTYTFKASATGYYDGTAAISINPGANNGTIKMNPKVGNAKITVLDKDTNKPVSGVQITVSVRGASQYVNTDANGVAAFNGIQIGAYAFGALKSGYNQSSVNVTIPVNGTGTGAITLSPIISATLHFNSSPKALTYVSGYLKAVNTSWSQSIRTIAADQTITVPNAGNYQFFAKWKDAKGNYRQTKSDIITISKSGTYTITPYGSPAN